MLPSANEQQGRGTADDDGIMASTTNQSWIEEALLSANEEMLNALRELRHDEQQQEERLRRGTTVEKCQETDTLTTAATTSSSSSSRTANAGTAIKLPQKRSSLEQSSHPDENDDDDDDEHGKNAAAISAATATAADENVTTGSGENFSNPDNVDAAVAAFMAREARKKHHVEQLPVKEWARVMVLQDSQLSKREGQIGMEQGSDKESLMVRLSKEQSENLAKEEAGKRGDNDETLRALVKTRLVEFLYKEYFSGA